MEAIQLVCRFETITCGKCGINFAIPQRLYEELRRTHEGFYCPHGHCRYYVGESTEEKLEAKLKRTQKRLEWAEEEARTNENRRRAEKAAKTKLKKRIEKGVCPCCNRTFLNLQRHMTTKHKGYLKD